MGKPPVGKASEANDTSVEEPATTGPATESVEADGEEELSEMEQQLKIVLDELESLRAENAQLKEKNTKSNSQVERLKQFALGRTPSSSAPSTQNSFQQKTIAEEPSGFDRKAWFTKEIDWDDN